MRWKEPALLGALTDSIVPRSPSVSFADSSLPEGAFCPLRTDSTTTVGETSPHRRSRAREKPRCPPAWNGGKTLPQNRSKSFWRGCGGGFFQKSSPAKNLPTSSSLLPRPQIQRIVAGREIQAQVLFGSNGAAHGEIAKAVCEVILAVGIKILRIA